MELTSFEDQRHMPYVTSIERLAEARGRSSVVLALLTEVYGAISEEEQVRVLRLSSEQLEQLARALLHFRSRDDLDLWLDTHSSTSE